MTTDRELMQQALDALECMDEGAFSKEVKLLRARLAQPEPEPVAWLADKDAMYFDREDAIRYSSDSVRPLYAVPPQREWQGLTDEEAQQIYTDAVGIRHAIAMSEAKLKEKNNE